MPTIATPPQSATSSKDARKGRDVDKPSRRRAVPKTDNELTITISVKDSIDSLAGKIDKLAEEMHEGNALVERRFGLLEQNALLVEGHSRVLEILQKDFAGFEQRFRDHDRSTFHAGGESAIAKLQTDVDNLKTNQLTQQAVKDFTDELYKQRKADRHWLIGVTVTMALFLLRELIPPLVRVAQAMPTPTMP